MFLRVALKMKRFVDGVSEQIETAISNKEDTIRERLDITFSKDNNLQLQHRNYKFRNIHFDGILLHPICMLSAKCYEWVIKYRLLFV